MSNNAYFEYTVVANDTLGRIAQRFYGTHETNLLEILKEINGLESIHKIILGQTLLLPYFYQYGVTTDMPRSSQSYMFQIKQGSSVNPVEFHHSELENEPVAARRFIYCWKKDLPEFIDKSYFEATLLPNLSEQSDKDKLENFYPTSVTNYPFSSSVSSFEFPNYSNPVTMSRILNSTLLTSQEQQDELFNILKKAGYPVWKNMGLLMTDDWGQPWRIAEYIEACKESGYFKYIASNYTEHRGDLGNYEYSELDFEGENENKSQTFTIYISDEDFSAQEHFAFYGPKEIAEIHFIEKAGDNPEQCESPHFTADAILDKREYFFPGSEYIFAFAPLDVIWARDEYVNIEKYPEIKERNMDGLSSADPLDYVKNVIKRTNFGEIINHPPTYYTSADWDPEQLVEDKLAQRIVIPEPEEGTYTKKAIKITLEPTIYEYISILQQYAYEFEKGLAIHIKSANNFSKLDMALGEIENLANLMRYYPNSDNIQSDYYTKLDQYKQMINNLKSEINEKEVDPDFSSDKTSLDHWLSAIPKEGKDAMELIKDQKPTEYVSLSDRLKKIEDLLDKSEFNNKLDEYLNIVEDENYQIEIDYFSFRHPCYTPIEIIINTFLNISHHPNHNEGMRIYKKYVKPFESILLSTYKDSDQQEFHTDVTKSLLTHFRDFSMEVDFNFPEEGINETQDVKMYSSTANGYFNTLSLIESMINDQDQYMDSEDHQNMAALSPTVLSTIWEKAKFILLTFSWNNQIGADSLGTKLIKAYQYFRITPLLTNTNVMFQSVVARNYKLTMTIMAQTYGGISRGTFTDVDLPNKRSVVKAYMEVSATEYYKNLFLRTKYIRRKPGNIGFVRNQLQQDMRILRNKLDEAFNVTSRAPAWVSTGFSSFQLVVSFIGIVDFFGKLDENTWIDYVKLISSLSNGALAITGFNLKHIMLLVNKFPRFRSFTLRTTRTIVRNSTKIGGGLTIVTLLADMVLYSVDAAWNKKTGDYFMMTMNIIRASLSGLGATVWVMQLCVPAVAKTFATYLVGSSLVSALGAAGAVTIIILVIMLIIMLIIFIRNKFKTGTRNTMELLINEMLKKAIEKVEKGSEYHDSTTIFNLATMWRRTEDNKIETYPPVSPYTHIITGMWATVITHSERTLTFELKRTSLHFSEKDGVYNYSSLRYKPLNYRYGVPSMVFRGWPLDMVKKLHETGWGDSHANQEDDDEVLEKVEILYNYWTNIQNRAIENNDETAMNDIQYMKNVINEGVILPESFFDSMISFSGGAH